MNRKVCIWIGMVFCFCIVAASFLDLSAEARTQRNLTVRTQLRPVRWPQGQLLWFAPGVVWIDDFDGGVQSGTLGQNAALKIWNTNRTVNFGPGFIRFEAAGGVKEGTLQADTVLCVVNTASNNKASLGFMGGKTVEFGYDGCVMKGTLAQQATLKSWDGKSATYPRGTLVDFNGAGLVTRAVLPAGAQIGIDGAYTGTCSIVGIGSFPFLFTARNGVFRGSQNTTFYSLNWQGNYDKNGVISNGLLTGWVDVYQGNQKIRWTIRGPIRGTLKAVGGSGTLSATSADGKRTWTGTWNANKTGP